MMSQFESLADLPTSQWLVKIQKSLIGLIMQDLLFYLQLNLILT